MQVRARHESIFTYSHDYRAFVAALEHGERCEIDEAMFVHWLESTVPLCMRHHVLLDDRHEIRADFVTESHDGGGALQAFWSRYEEGNPTHCRYFAQRATCLV